MRVVPCRGCSHAGSILRQQLGKLRKCMKIKRSEKLRGLNSFMHLKFAYANIQSCFFPMDFLPTQYYIHKYIYRCSSVNGFNIWAEAPASGEQSAKSIRERGYSDLPIQIISVQYIPLIWDQVESKEELPEASRGEFDRVRNIEKDILYTSNQDDSTEFGKQQKFRLSNMS